MKIVFELSSNALLICSSELTWLVSDEIVAKIRESGFKVAMKKEVNLTKEQAEEFYKEHKNQDYFEELTTRMSS